MDAWATSGERGSAKRAERILNAMLNNYKQFGDPDAIPNVHTAYAVCTAYAFTKIESDPVEALEKAFRVFDWIQSQADMHAVAYTYTILLSVCLNSRPKEDGCRRYAHEERDLSSTG